MAASGRKGGQIGGKSYPNFRFGQLSCQNGYVAEVVSGLGQKVKRTGQKDVTASRLPPCSLKAGISNPPRLVPTVRERIRSCYLR